MSSSPSRRLSPAAAQLIFLLEFLPQPEDGRAGADESVERDDARVELPARLLPPDNFGGQFPSVYRGPYEYSVPGEPNDFLPQDLAARGQLEAT